MKSVYLLLFANAKSIVYIIFRCRRNQQSNIISIYFYLINFIRK